jgi:hypothetical protein
VLAKAEGESQSSLVNYTNLPVGMTPEESNQFQLDEAHVDLGIIHVPESEDEQ